MKKEPDSTEHDFIAPAGKKTRLVFPKSERVKLRISCFSQMKDLISVSVYQLRDNPHDEMHVIDNKCTYPVFVIKERAKQERPQ